MLHVDLKPLVGKLNETCRRTLEGAAALCLSRTNYNVEVEHWLFKLLETTDTDVAAALRHFEIDASRVCKDVSRILDRLKTGNARAPAFSPDTVDLVRGAWLVGSINFDATKTRTGHVLLALLADDTLNRVLRDASPEFEKLSAEDLRKNFISITARSAETEESKSVSGPAAEGAKRPEGGGALDKYTIDLTARARRGEIDPVRCREAEIRQVVDILTRRRQNNPILTGEAGVGKTAVVEGFAIRIVENDVPPALRNVQLRTLDLGLLQAGAGIKGEFENRLKSVIEEVKGSSRPVILFIDEAHTLIGAGGQAGQGDAANMLKPALARGELRTIAATTWAEYKKYFEKDAALARRFQVVKVEEPDEDSAIKMVRGLCDTLEKHHHVRILDDAIDQAVRLSHRYLSGRQLPDKAISLIDTASARVAIGQSTVPPAVEECRWRIRHASLEIDILKREIAAGAEHSERLAEREASKAAAEAELKELEARWEKEAGLVAQIRPIRQQLEASAQLAGGSKAHRRGISRCRGRRRRNLQPAPEPPSPPLTPEQLDALRSQLHGLEAQLKEIQGENPLMQACVDGQAVAEVVSGWTGIPVGRMVKDEIRAVLVAQAVDAAADRGSGPRPGGHLAEHPHVAGRPDRPPPPHRRLPAGRHQRHGQDGNRHHPGRVALWRRAEHDRHQHVGVQGGAQGLAADGLAAGLRGLRRGRSADRGRSPPALQRRALGRDREGPSGRPGHFLPGLRQGNAPRRRGPRHRLQEHGDHDDLQRRLRDDDEHLLRPGDLSQRRAVARGHSPGAREGLQARLPGPNQRRSLLSALRRGSEGGSWCCN